MCIVVEEADETLFWIEMLFECQMLTINEFEYASKEAEEILKVMPAFKNKLRKGN